MVPAESGAWCPNVSGCAGPAVWEFGDQQPVVAERTAFLPPSWIPALGLLFWYQAHDAAWVRCEPLCLADVTRRPRTLRGPD